MKKRKIDFKIEKIICENAQKIISLYFLVLSVAFYMLSLPDGTTKFKNILLAVGLIISVILFVVRNDSPKYFKYFPFVFYIFMCACSLPLGRNTFITNKLFVKPICTSCIILLLIYLERLKRTGIIVNLRSLLVVLFLWFMMFDILILGEINYLSGNQYETIIGYTNRIYHEIFLVCYGSALNIPIGKDLHLNRKLFIKLINILIICGVVLITAFTIIINATNTIILPRELFPSFMLYWWILSAFTFFITILCTKKKFPGDRVSQKLFYDKWDIELSRRQLLEYKKVVKQINELINKIDSESDERRIQMEEKIIELQAYARYLKNNNVVIKGKE